MSAMDAGQVVPGYVTFVGREASWAGRQFMSFSYSVNGQHFHKSLNETVDAWSTTTLRKASYGLQWETRCLSGVLSPTRRCVALAKNQQRNPRSCGG